MEGPILHPVAPATRLSSLVLPPVLNTLCLKSALLLFSVLLLPWVGAPSLLPESGLEVKWNLTAAVCVCGNEVVSWCASVPAVCLDLVGVSHVLPKKRGHFLPPTPFLSLSLA